MKRLLLIIAMACICSTPSFATDVAQPEQQQTEVKTKKKKKKKKSRELQLCAATQEEQPASAQAQPTESDVAAAPIAANREQRCSKCGKNSTDGRCPSNPNGINPDFAVA